VIELVEAIPFEVFSLKKKIVIWFDKINFNEYHKLNHDYDSINYFSELFSYSTGTELFQCDNLSTNSSNTFYAERYGGIGIGTNGGGARCGYYKSYQIKGVGRTPLVGKDCETWHSYGGLSLFDAIYEAIYSKILNNVLPKGAVNTCGVRFVEMYHLSLSLPYYLISYFDRFGSKTDPNPDCQTISNMSAIRFI
jgi:hypothetical protein